MATLPKELNYTSKLQALPSSTRTISVVVSPNNGATFNAGGEVIAFDLPSRGFLVPNSMYLRYRATILKTVEPTVMLGTPAYTPFSRLETIIGAQVVESIQDWNAVCNMVTNCKLNVAQKASLANAFGYLDKTSDPTAVNMNGRTIGFHATIPSVHDFAMPLNSILANCENLFPLGLAPAVRIQLTTEALTSMFSTTTTAATSSVLSKLELCFDIVEFGPEVEAVVKSMADSNGDLIIKSQSYTSSTLSLGTGGTGSAELAFNQRISSIKSIFALFAPLTGAKKFSSKDITENLGDYQFFIGSEAYPPRPLSAQNKAGTYLELCQAWGNAGSVDSYNMAINPAEYQCVSDTADTGVVPGKYYVGANVERLCGSAILTGVSSQLSPINLRINYGGSVCTEAMNASLVTVFDALLSLNVITRQCSVKT